MMTIICYFHSAHVQRAQPVLYIRIIQFDCKPVDTAAAAAFIQTPKATKFVSTLIYLAAKLRLCVCTQCLYTYVALCRCTRPAYAQITACLTQTSPQDLCQL